jgi:hypothetical protein
MFNLGPGPRCDHKTLRSSRSHFFKTSPWKSTQQKNSTTLEVPFFEKKKKYFPVHEPLVRVNFNIKIQGRSFLLQSQKLMIFPRFSPENCSVKHSLALQPLRLQEVHSTAEPKLTAKLFTSCERQSFKKLARRLQTNFASDSSIVRRIFFLPSSARFDALSITQDGARRKQHQKMCHEYVRKKRFLMILDSKHFFFRDEKFSSLR